MIRLLSLLLIAAASLLAQPANLPANAEIHPEQIVKAGDLRFFNVRGPLGVATEQRYIALRFQARSTERIIVIVRMKDGKPESLITDENLKPIVVATSKGPSGERAMYLRATLPGEDPKEVRTYLVLVREQDDRNTTFTVELQRDNATQTPTAQNPK